MVCGGHTFLVEMPDHLTYRLLGQTVDDAAGEAFDKVGRLLGLPYPGGPAIQRAAAEAVRHDRHFPRAWLGDGYDFSFSGLKTAARRAVTEAAGGTADDGVGAAAGPRGRDGLGLPGVGRGRPGDQDRAGGPAGRCGHHRPRRRRGRQRRAARPRADQAADLGIPVVIPRPGLCTDNGAMIGAAGFLRARAGVRAGWDLEAYPSLRLAG